MRSALGKKNRQGLRELLFPAIDMEIITGFNIYQDRPIVRDDFLLSYMHSDLDEEDRHRQQLFDALEGYSPTVVSAERCNIVGRETDYKIPEEDWIYEGLKLFDEGARSISDRDTALERLELGKTVIGEDTQSELRIQLSIEDLAKIVEIFSNRVFLQKIDPVTWKPLDIRNEYAIEGAWRIPLICIEPKTKDLRKEIPPSYKGIVKQEIGGYKEEVSSLVDKSSDVFRGYLGKRGCKTEKRDVFAHRTFVNFINGEENQANQKYLKNER